MDEHEQAAASHGSGMQIAQRHLANARAAATSEERVIALTDAVEALLLHLRFAEGETASAPRGTSRNGLEPGAAGA